MHRTNKLSTCLNQSNIHNKILQNGVFKQQNESATRPHDLQQCTKKHIHRADCNQEFQYESNSWYQSWKKILTIQYENK